MNSRRPTTAEIDQLSLNLSVTRFPDIYVLVSVLLWSPSTLGGGVAGAVLLCLAGCLEAVGGTAQYGGLALPALGGLCDGGSLLTAVGAHLSAEEPMKAWMLVLALSRMALS